MQILNLQATYLSDIINSLEDVKAQRFDAIQLDVLDYLEKNRKNYDSFSTAFDLGGVDIDVRDELGNMNDLKKLCSLASALGISIYVKIKNTNYLGQTLHGLKKRIKLLLKYTTEKHIDLIGIDNKSEEAYLKMLINYKKENGQFDINEIFELYRTSMFKDANSKELTTYLHKLMSIGVKGFAFDDTLSKDTKLGERLSIYLSLNHIFSYILNHPTKNIEEYYEYPETEEEIMEAKNETSYEISSELSENVIFTPVLKDTYDSYWCTSDRDRDSQYEIARFKDEYRFSSKIRKVNSGKVLTKTN